MKEFTIFDISPAPGIPAATGQEISQSAEVSTLQPGDHYDVVSIVPWDMVFTLVNFIILMLILKRFLLKPVQNMLDKRKQLAEKELEDAQNAKVSAQQSQSQYLAQLAQIKQESAEILTAANRQAQNNADLIIKQANEKAAQAIASGEAEIARQKDKAMDELKNDVGEMAAQLAKKAMKKQMTKQENDRLIADILEEMNS